MDLDTGLKFPVELLYSIDSAVLMIPTTSRQAVYSLLYKYKDSLSEPKYRRAHTGVKMRMLTGDDIRTLRNVVVKKGFYTGRYKK